MECRLNGKTIFGFLILFFCLSCEPTSPNRLIDHYFIEPDFSYRGAKNDLFPAQLLEEAEKAYQKGDYDNAIGTLGKMPFSSGNYNHSLYLTAAIALKQGNGQLAITKYRNYLGTQDQQFIEQAHFSLTLAYLLQKQVEAAKAQIKYIIENKNAFSRTYVEQTLEIRQQLE